MSSFSPQALLTSFALALVVGLAVHRCSLRMGWPSIALLLLAGIVLGPAGVHAIRVDAIGDGSIEVLIHIVVAAVLFEAGLTLNPVEEGNRSKPRGVGRLVILIGIATWLGASLLVRLLFSVAWPVAFLAGSLMVATGPTVVAPLLLQLRLRRDLAAVLHWEATLLEPIGAFVVFLCLECMTLGGSELSFWGPLSSMVGRVAIAVALGGVGIVLIRRFGRSRPAIEIWLACFVLYSASNALLAHSGLLAVVVAGMGVRRWGGAAADRIETLGRQLTEPAIATLFIVLSANLDLSQFSKIGARGAIFVALLIVLARPAAVALASWGTGVTLRGRVALGLIAPRGIVMVALASLCGREAVAAGYSEAAMIEPLMFATVMGTIVVYGMLAPPMTRLLRLTERRRDGWLVVGANPLGVLIAHRLRQSGLRVGLVDTRPRGLREARAEGLKAFRIAGFRNGTFDEDRFQGFGNVLSVTDDPARNRSAVHSWRSTVPLGIAATWEHLVTDAPEFQRTRGVEIGLLSGALDIEVTKSPASGTLLNFPGNPFGSGDPRRLAIVRRAFDCLGPVRAVLPMTVPDASVACYRLLSLASECLPAFDADDAMGALGRRERQGPMIFDLRNGVAVPHIVTHAVSEPAIFAGVLRKPVAASDDARIRLLLLLLSPAGKSATHLQTLAALCRWARDAKNVDRVFMGHSPSDMKSAIGISLPNNVPAVFPNEGMDTASSREIA